MGKHVSDILGLGNLAKVKHMTKRNSCNQEFCMDELPCGRTNLYR